MIHTLAKFVIAMSFFIWQSDLFDNGIHLDSRVDLIVTGIACLLFSLVFVR